MGLSWGMARRPSPRALRKALDEAEVQETRGEGKSAETATEALEATISGTPPRREWRKDPRRSPERLPDDLIPSMRGRPGIYSDSFPELARRLALIGMSDEEMAKIFDVAVSTLYRWDETYPNFREARAKGGVHADGAVVARLYHRAIGYSHEAVKIFMPAGAEEPVYAPYIEHVPPDTQAMIWWLKNRQKDKWKDKSEVDWTGRMEIGIVPYDPDSLTTEQREVMRDVLLTAPKTIEGKVE